MTDETSNDDMIINDVDASFSSGIAAFEAKNFKQSLQFLAPLAEAGDAESQHRCAIMYQNGLGIVANEAKAAEYMRAAAEQGHAIAQHGLGFMYMEGECVEPNAQEAVKWRNVIHVEDAVAIVVRVQGVAAQVTVRVDRRGGGIQRV